MEIQYYVLVLAFGTVGGALGGLLFMHYVKPWLGRWSDRRYEQRIERRISDMFDRIERHAAERWQQKTYIVGNGFDTDSPRKRAGERAGAR